MRVLAVLNLLIIIMIVSCAYAMELGSEGRWFDLEELVEKKNAESKILESIGTVKELCLALDREGRNLKKLVPKIKPSVLVEHFGSQVLELPYLSMAFRKRIWEKIEAEDGELYSVFASFMICQITGKGGKISGEHFNKFLNYVVEVEVENLSKEEKKI